MQTATDGGQPLALILGLSGAAGMAALGVPTDVRQRVTNQISGQGIGGR
jgi:hypothetical protein